MDQREATILSQEQLNVAIKSPEHLKEWLGKSGRRWMIFNGEELIDALPFPHGHEALMEIIMAYRGHRIVIPSGEFRNVEDAFGNTVREPLMKTEKLSLVELDRCIRSLIHEASTLDRNWSLNNPAL